MKKEISKVLLVVVLFLTGLLILEAPVIHADISQSWVQPPVIFTSITPRTSKIKVYVDGDSTLYVKKGKHILFKKHYKNEGIKTITIPKQKTNTKLKFYVKGMRFDKKHTSKKVTIKVVKKAPKKVALKKPILNFNEETTQINITGKTGTKVYVREVINDKKQKWIYYGVILNKHGITKMLDGFNPSKNYTSSNYFQVRLKDLDGKYSKITNLDLTNYTPTDMEVTVHY